MHEEDAAVFAQNAVNAAQSAVKLALVQYREGATDYQRVVDSQRALLDSQNNLARIHSATTTSLIGLYKALVGGWQVHQGQPVVTDQNRVEMQKRTNWNGYFSKAAAAPHETEANK